MSNDLFPIGSYVQLSPAGLKNCHESLRAPTVFKMCEVTDPRNAKAGFLAMQILTGKRAYSSVLVKPDQIEPAKPCYGCRNAKHMNDPSQVRCGFASDTIMNSAMTCYAWEARHA